MVRIYRIARFVDARYELVDFCLDPSAAAARALEESRALDSRSYVLVTQVDVYPNLSECHEFLRVDGLLASPRARTR